MGNDVDFNKISVHGTPDRSPGFLLWQVSTAWRGAIEVMLHSFGLTHPQFVVLATTGWLTRNGEKVTQAAVGNLAGLDPNTCSQVIRGLEKKGFIARENSADGRVKNPVLTVAGAKVLNKALPAVEAQDKQFFIVLNAREIEATIAVFHKLAR